MDIKENTKDKDDSIDKLTDGEGDARAIDLAAITAAASEDIGDDPSEGLNSRLHAMSVTAVKGRCGAIMLPFIALAVPFAAVAALTLLLLSPLTAIIWQLLALSVFNTDEGPIKYGFKRFFAPIKDRALISASALYRLMTLFAALLLLLPSLLVRLNFCMFPYVIASYRASGREIDAIEAFDKSKEIMKGNKMKYLSLLLYSLPAVLLTVLTLGLVSVWTIPYIEAMKAHFYIDITKSD